MKIRISTEARDDLKDGFRFYESQCQGLGKRFRESVLEEIDSLRNLAGIHAVEFGYQRLICRKFPYIVYYELSGSTVSIVAVVDARRDPAWIVRRLK